MAPVAAAALALCAWLHARGVGALVGSTLASPALHVLPDAAPGPAAEAPRSADPILARNPFDSTTGSLLGVPPVVTPPDGGLRACEGVRVASIVASTDPDWSFAMLELRGEHEPVLRRRGGEVIGIGVDRVVLDRDGRRCVARIFPSSGPGDARTPASASRGIVRTGPGEYAIDRGTRDALVDGAADLMRAVMVAPEKKGDEVVGLRVVSLRPGTPLDALGLRAGDVIVSAAGIPFNSPEHMLEACGRLRTQEHIRVELVRGGAPAQLDFDVR
jgi:general secretion pathway protein C